MNWRGWAISMAIIIIGSIALSVVFAVMDYYLGAPYPF